LRIVKIVGSKSSGTGESADVVDEWEVEISMVIAEFLKAGAIPEASKKREVQE